MFHEFALILPNGDYLILILTLVLLDPFIRLALRVDEKWPPVRIISDDAVFPAESIQR